MTVLVIRVDASVTIGSGHVVRCRTLARELSRRGAEVRFVCRRQPGDMIEILAEEFSILELPELPLANTESAEGNRLRGVSLYKAWLGCSESDDAIDTLDVLRRHDVKPNWVIVDHYGLGAEWEMEVRERLSEETELRLLAIDDLANRRHEVEYLVDQNIATSAKKIRYEGSVPASCQMLLGPQYALLGREYSDLHGITPDRIRLGRLLVYFGGSDCHSLNVRTLKALMTSELSEISVDVVLGVQTKEYQEVEEIAKKTQNIRLYTSQSSLAGLMVRADLAVGASGATTWERSCLGLPSLVIGIAENQFEIARELDEIGAIQYLGEAEQISVEDIRAALLNARANFERLSRVERLTDGWGASRIATSLMGVAEPLRWREDRSIHMPRLDTLTRKSLDEEETNKEESGGNVISQIVIGDREGCPIAQLRFASEYSSEDRKKEHVVLDIKLDRCAASEDQVNKMVRFALEKMRSGWEYRYSSVERQKGDGSAKILHFAKAYMNSTSKHSPGVDAMEESRVTLLTSKETWLNDHIPGLIKEIWGRGHALRWVHDRKDLVFGDACFILGFDRLLNKEELRLHKHNLVVHESDLPHGQGWSPMTWQIIGGESRIPVTLFEAEVDLDAGPVYMKRDIHLDGTELVSEWRARQAEATISLCLEWIDNYRKVVKRAERQSGTPTFFRRRRPQDSRLDVTRSLKEQFDLLRVVDNQRYPAFMDIRGERYYFRINK